MQLLLLGQVEALPCNARHLKRIMKLLAVDLLHPSHNIVIEPKKSTISFPPTKSASPNKPGVTNNEPKKEFFETDSIEGCSSPLLASPEDVKVALHLKGSAMVVVVAMKAVVVAMMAAMMVAMMVVVVVVMMVMAAEAMMVGSPGMRLQVPQALVKE